MGRGWLASCYRLLNTRFMNVAQCVAGWGLLAVQVARASFLNNGAEICKKTTII